MAIWFFLKESVFILLASILTTTFSTDFSKVLTKVKFGPENSAELNKFLQQLLIKHENLEWVDRLSQTYRGIGSNSVLHSPIFISKLQNDNNLSSQDLGKRRNLLKRNERYYKNRRKLRSNYIINQKNRNELPRLNIEDYENAMTGVLKKEGYKQQRVKQKRNQIEAPRMTSYTYAYQYWKLPKSSNQAYKNNDYEDYTERSSHYVPKPTDKNIELEEMLKIVEPEGKPIKKLNFEKNKKHRNKNSKKLTITEKIFENKRNTNKDIDEDDPLNMISKNVKVISNLEINAYPGKTYIQHEVSNSINSKPVTTVSNEEFKEEEKREEIIEEDPASVMTPQQIRRAKIEAKKLLDVDQDFNERNEPNFNKEVMKTKNMDYKDLYDYLENKFEQENEEEIREKREIKNNKEHEEKSFFSRQLLNYNYDDYENNFNSYDDQENTLSRYPRELNENYKFLNENDDYLENQNEEPLEERYHKRRWKKEANYNNQKDPKGDLKNKIKKLKTFFGFGQENNYNEIVQDDYPLQVMPNEYTVKYNELSDDNILETYSEKPGTHSENMSGDENNSNQSLNDDLDLSSNAFDESTQNDFKSMHENAIEKNEEPFEIKVEEPPSVQYTPIIRKENKNSYSQSTLPKIFTKKQTTKASSITDRWSDVNSILGTTFSIESKINRNENIKPNINLEKSKIKPTTNSLSTIETNKNTVKQQIKTSTTISENKNILLPKVTPSNPLTYSFQYRMNLFSNTPTSSTNSQVITKKYKLSKRDFLTKFFEHFKKKSAKTTQTISTEGNVVKDETNTNTMNDLTDRLKNSVNHDHRHKLRHKYRFSQSNEYKELLKNLQLPSAQANVDELRLNVMKKIKEKEKNKIGLTNIKTRDACEEDNMNDLDDEDYITSDYGNCRKTESEVFNEDQVREYPKEMEKDNAESNPVKIDNNNYYFNGKKGPKEKKRHDVYDYKMVKLSCPAITNFSTACEKPTTCSTPTTCPTTSKTTPTTTTCKPSTCPTTSTTTWKPKTCPTTCPTTCKPITCPTNSTTNTTACPTTTTICKPKTCPTTQCKTTCPTTTCKTTCPTTTCKTTCPTTTCKTTCPTTTCKTTCPTTTCKPKTCPTTCKTTCPTTTCKTTCPTTTCKPKTCPTTCKTTTARTCKTFPRKHKHKTCPTTCKTTTCPPKTCSTTTCKPKTCPTTCPTTTANTCKHKNSHSTHKFGKKCTPVQKAKKLLERHNNFHESSHFDTRHHKVKFAPDRFQRQLRFPKKHYLYKDMPRYEYQEMKHRNFINRLKRQYFPFDNSKETNLIRRKKSINYDKDLEQYNGIPIYRVYPRRIQRYKRRKMKNDDEAEDEKQRKVLETIFHHRIQRNGNDSECGKKPHSSDEFKAKTAAGDSTFNDDALQGKISAKIVQNLYDDKRVNNIIRGALRTPSVDPNNPFPNCEKSEKGVKDEKCKKGEKETKETKQCKDNQETKPCKDNQETKQCKDNQLTVSLLKEIKEKINSMGNTGNTGNTKCTKLDNDLEQFLKIIVAHIKDITVFNNISPKANSCNGNKLNSTASSINGTNFSFNSCNTTQKCAVTTTPEKKCETQTNISNACKNTAKANETTTPEKKCETQTNISNACKNTAKANETATKTKPTCSAPHEDHGTNNSSDRCIIFKCANSQDNASTTKSANHETSTCAPCKQTTVTTKTKATKTTTTKCATTKPTTKNPNTCPTSTTDKQKSSACNSTKATEKCASKVKCPLAKNTACPNSNDHKNQTVNNPVHSPNAPASEHFAVKKWPETLKWTVEVINFDKPNKCGSNITNPKTKIIQLALPKEHLEQKLSQKTGSTTSNHKKTVSKTCNHQKTCPTTCSTTCPTTCSQPKTCPTCPTTCSQPKTCPTTNNHQKTCANNHKRKKLENTIQETTHKLPLTHREVTNLLAMYNNLPEAEKRNNKYIYSYLHSQKLFLESLMFQFRKFNRHKRFRNLRKGHYLRHHNVWIPNRAQSPSKNYMQLQKRLTSDDQKEFFRNRVKRGTYFRDVMRSRRIPDTSTISKLDEWMRINREDHDALNLNFTF